MNSAQPLSKTLQFGLLSYCWMACSPTCPPTRAKTRGLQAVKPVQLCQHRPARPCRPLPPTYPCHPEGQGQHRPSIPVSPHPGSATSPHPCSPSGGDSLTYEGKEGLETSGFISAAGSSLGRMLPALINQMIKAFVRILPSGERLCRRTDSTAEPCSAPPNPAFLSCELLAPASAPSSPTREGNRRRGDGMPSKRSFSFPASQRFNMHMSDLGPCSFSAFKMVFIFFPLF